MSFDTSGRSTAPPIGPIQFVNIEITPLVGGNYSIVMQATRLDEEELEFVGQDLAHQHVETLDDALAIIRENVVSLQTQAQL